MNLLLRMDPALAEGKVSTTPVASSIIAAIEVQHAVELLHGFPPRRGQTHVFNGTTSEAYVAIFEAKDTEWHPHTLMQGPVDTKAIPCSAAATRVSDLLDHAEGLLGETPR